jgi:multidrug efflux pump
MRRTDLFIQRPVLAIVVSVFILLLGLRASTTLPVRPFPRTVDANIDVQTAYYGADADVVAGFITTPLETAIAQVSGIDHNGEQQHQRHKRHQHPFAAEPGP